MLVNIDMIKKLGVCLVVFSTLISCSCAKKSKTDIQAVSPLSTYYSTTSQVFDIDNVIDAYFYGDDYVYQTYQNSLDYEDEDTYPDNHAYIVTRDGDILSDFDLQEELGISSISRVIHCDGNYCYFLSDIDYETQGYPRYCLDIYDTNQGFIQHIDINIDRDSGFLYDFFIIDEQQIGLLCSGEEDQILVVDHNGQIQEDILFPDAYCYDFFVFQDEITCIGMNDQVEFYIYSYQSKNSEWKQTQIAYGSYIQASATDKDIFGICYDKLVWLGSSEEISSVNWEDVSIFGSVKDVKYQPDGKINILTIPSSFKHVVNYQLTPSAEPMNREQFVIAGYDLSSSFVPSLIEEISLLYPDIQFLVHDYSEDIQHSDEDDWELAQKEIFTQMSLDIASGNEPDMYFDSYDDTGLGEMGRLGYLMDLTTFVNSLDENEYFIDKLSMGKEHPNCICLSYSISCFMASDQYVKYTDEWTYDDFYKSAENFNDLSCVQSFYSKEMLLEDGVLAQMDKYVVDGQANFLSDDFIQLLKWTNDIGCDTLWDDYVDAELDDGLFMFDYASIASLREFLYLGNHQMFVGYPNENGSLHTLPSNILAVSSTCERADIAMEIMKFAMNESFQERMVNYSGNPINRYIFDETFNSRYEYYEEYDPDMLLYDREEYYDLFIGTINRADRYVHGYQAILDICIEEAESYYAGDITAERAAELIQNRATLYLQETAIP